MDPILLLKPELVRFRTIGAYRTWEQVQTGSQSSAQRPYRIVSGLRRLIAARRPDREPRRVVLALDDNVFGS